ncbi:MAG: hypothetical protein GY832_33005, partial [Chloroflexi bacterium]|nr:hypothetical protein [Chloroflexota bacterium]
MYQLIKNAGSFKQQSTLWDSLYNLQQMAEMQNDVLTRRTQLGALNRLYGGLVTSQYVTPGGIGSAGQPRKFYAPLPQLTTLVRYADEDVDSMVDRHFKLGMPRLELGQYMIGVGGDVDLTKVGRQMLQSRERGMQRMERSTGRIGMTTMLDQINTYRSVVGSEMGDPVPVQLLPTTMDDTVPPLTVVQFREGFFKWPLPPGDQFRINRPMPKPLVKPMLQCLRAMSPAGSS